MRWWRTHPEAWAYIRRNPVPPGVGMEHCLDWLKGLGPDLVLAAHPLLMDGVWLDWHLRRFCNAAVFSGPVPHPLSLRRRGRGCAVLCSAGLAHGVLHRSPGLSAGAAPRRVPHRQADRRRARARRAAFQRPATREDARDLVGEVLLANRPSARQVNFAARRLACESSRRSRGRKEPRECQRPAPPQRDRRAATPGLPLRRLVHRAAGPSTERERERDVRGRGAHHPEF